jgi:hypothetical protein
VSFPFDLQSAAVFDSHIPFRSHAVPLRVYIVSFPVDLHSAAVFDSHMSCRSHAVSLPYHEHAVLKTTSQGHGRFAAGERHDMCESNTAALCKSIGKDTM